MQIEIILISDNIEIKQSCNNSFFSVTLGCNFSIRKDNQGLYEIRGGGKVLVIDYNDLVADPNWSDESTFFIFMQSLICK